MLTIVFQGGPHNAARFELPEEVDHYPELYTFQDETYERTLIPNHAGERIYVYRGPEPVAEDAPEPAGQEDDGAA